MVHYIDVLHFKQNMSPNLSNSWMPNFMSEIIRYLKTNWTSNFITAKIFSNFSLGRSPNSKIAFMTNLRWRIYFFLESEIYRQRFFCFINMLYMEHCLKFGLKIEMHFWTKGLYFPQYNIIHSALKFANKSTSWGSRTVCLKG